MTVTLKSIEEARETLQGIAKKTPMIESPVLGNRMRICKRPVPSRSAVPSTGFPI